jgi:acyl carrier protein
MELFNKVAGVVAEQLEIEVDSIKQESKFTEDLGADSLDVVELVMALEETFDIEIPDEAAEGIKTVQDAINFIQDNK